MTKVFITGADSFTGGYLIDALEEQECQVFGLTLIKPTKLNFFTGDLLNLDRLTEIITICQPDIIIHLAALTFVNHFDAEVFYKVNLFGTENLLKAIAASRCNPQKIIVASSANVYGAAGQGMVSEKTCPLPVNHYASSKLAMEHMVRTWYDKYPIIMTRPFNYTGVGQDLNFLVPKIVEHYAKKEKSIELGNINIQRDFSDVHDIVGAILALLDSDIHSEIFNLCSGIPYSIQEIVANLNELAEYDINVKVNPDFIRENEIKCLVGDNSKLKKATNFSPTFSFKETLSEMYSARKTLNSSIGT